MDGDGRAGGRATALYAAWVVLLCGLGLALRYKALFMGFVADDYAQLGMLQGHYLVPRSAFDLFDFSDGSLEEGQTLLRGGFYHWWSHPNLRLSMLRPLASAMIWLDWNLFGNFALGHHLHSLLWWLSLLGTTAYVFARLLPLKVAALAFALFVLDEAHGVALAWIANRSVFVTSTITLLTLLYYIRYRRSPSLRGGVVIAASLSLSLAFGEYTLCGLGFFLSYELLAERGTLPARLRYLSPVLLPAAAFMALRYGLGHEPRMSGVYVGLADPGELAAALWSRLPVLYSDLLFAVRSEYWTFGPPWTQWLLEQGLASRDWLTSLQPWRSVHERIGLVALVLVIGLVGLAPSEGRYRHTRWLAVGGALATVPVISSFPSSRLLLVALVGFTPLVASFVVSALEDLRARWKSAPVATLGRLSVALPLCLYQLVIPAWLSHSEMAGLYEASQDVRSAVLNMEAGPRFAQQRVVVLSAAEDGTSMYIPLTRQQYGLPAPARCWTLSRALAPFMLLRDSPRSLVIRFDHGFSMLTTAPEQLLRTPAAPLYVGETIDLDGMRATVLQLLEGRPVAVRFEFDVELEDASLHFVFPTHAGIRRFVLPALGQSVTVPSPVIPPRSSAPSPLGASAL